jgi:Uma2 family endonuclease
MSAVLEQPIDMDTAEPTGLEERFRELADRWPDHKFEIIDGRIVVREMTTGAHNDIVFRLFSLLIAVVSERGWKIWPDITVFLGPQRDRYRPDLTVVPARPRMWGEDHVHADDTLLVVEVVSHSSKHDDDVVKPLECARGGVPLYLVVDTFDDTVRLFSRPSDDGYKHKTEIKLGDELALPEPWDSTLDTGELVD